MRHWQKKVARARAYRKISAGLSASHLGSLRVPQPLLVLPHLQLAGEGEQKGGCGCVPRPSHRQVLDMPSPRGQFAVFSVHAGLPVSAQNASSYPWGRRLVYSVPSKIRWPRRWSPVGRGQLHALGRHDYRSRRHLLAVSRSCEGCVDSKRAIHRGKGGKCNRGYPTKPVPLGKR